ncbi:hypothetical protein Tco_1461173 [Tanacetum coccineum]
MTFLETHTTIEKPRDTYKKAKGKIQTEEEGSDKQPPLRSKDILLLCSIGGVVVGIQLMKSEDGRKNWVEIYERMFDTKADSFGSAIANLDPVRIKLVSKQDLGHSFFSLETLFTRNTVHPKHYSSKVMTNKKVAELDVEFIEYKVEAKASMNVLEKKIDDGIGKLDASIKGMKEESDAKFEELKQLILGTSTHVDHVPQTTKVAAKTAPYVSPIQRGYYDIGLELHNSNAESSTIMGKNLRP